jgi:2-keto-4-pentenoate hydratase
MAQAVWEDERVVRGMHANLARQRETHGQRIGWKTGLGLPALLEKLGTSGPLVAVLGDLTLRESGSELSVDGWVNPVFEPEIAAYIGHDVTPGGTLEDAAAAIQALGPAIEMVDSAAPPTDPETVLATGFAHKAILLGHEDTGRAGGITEGLATRVTSNGEPLGETDDPVGAVGYSPVQIVRHVADYLAAFGEVLREGEFVICGSTLAPPPPVTAGQTLVFELVGAGSVSVALTD